MSTDFDVLVVGGGHNGLVAALRLARAGRKVAVLERRQVAGGLCAGEEFHPGYRVPGMLHDDGRVPATLAAQLGLEAHGLELEAPPPVYAATPAGGLLLPRDPASAREHIAAHSPADAEAYGRWRAFLGRIGGFLADTLQSPPPPLLAGSAAEWWQLGRRGLALRRLGRRDMLELLRVAPMAVADWLNEYFETPLLVELLAAPAVQATFNGPWSAGTATGLLLHECLVERSIRGGPAAFTDILARACLAAGVELRTGAEVRRIHLEKGRVAGVELAGGEKLEAQVVAAACDAKKAFLELLPAGSLDLRIENQLRTVRARGTAAKVHLALDGPLEIDGWQGEPLASIRVGGGHVDQLERAFDAIKYGRFSSPPHLEVRVPSVTTPELAPDGCHVVSMLVSFAPHDLRAGWSDAEREALGDAAVAALARHAPDLQARLVARQVLTPRDLEERYAVTGGCLHHAEHALDQLLFMRPAPCAARYATPVEGFFLCGSGSHPGGGVTGLPGYLAAAAILA